MQVLITTTVSVYLSAESVPGQWRPLLLKPITFACNRRWFRETCLEVTTVFDLIIYFTRVGEIDNE